MHTSARSAFLHCSRTTSLTSRTAVYGPVRTVVWQGSAGDCRPYADRTGISDEWILDSGAGRQSANTILPG
jgi:hypothetical protein